LHDWELSDAKPVSAPARDADAERSQIAVLIDDEEGEMDEFGSSCGVLGMFAQVRGRGKDADSDEYAFDDADDVDDDDDEDDEFYDDDFDDDDDDDDFDDFPPDDDD